MADSSDTAAAELRLARVKALSDRDHVALVTYLLARYPDEFPAMLDDALSTLSPAGRDGGPGGGPAGENSGAAPAG